MQIAGVDNLRQRERQVATAAQTSSSISLVGAELAASVPIPVSADRMLGVRLLPLARIEARPIHAVKLGRCCLWRILEPFLQQTRQTDRVVLCAEAN